MDPSALLPEGDISHFLYSPLSWGLLLAVVLVWRWSRLGRPLRVIAVAAGVGLLLLCTPFGANQLVRLIEWQTPASARCVDADPGPLVVLSGGFEGEPTTARDYAALNRESWRRLQGAIVWQRAHPQGVLWISGGGPYRIKEADVLASLALDWHASASRLRTETASTTTWDSALKLREALPRRIVLATSALHMPRALIAFRAAGFAPCALPTSSQYISSRSLATLLPQVSAMYKTEEATYEIAGTGYYLLRRLRQPKDRRPWPDQARAGAAASGLQPAPR